MIYDDIESLSTQGITRHILPHMSVADVGVDAGDESDRGRSFAAQLSHRLPGAAWDG